ncbi:hypothetical protein RN001_006177, partial [Aquatica leii]
NGRLENKMLLPDKELLEIIENWKQSKDKYDSSNSEDSSNVDADNLGIGNIPITFKGQIADTKEDTKNLEEQRNKSSVLEVIEHGVKKTSI